MSRKKGPPKQKSITSGNTNKDLQPVDYHTDSNSSKNPLEESAHRDYFEVTDRMPQTLYEDSLYAPSQFTNLKDQKIKVEEQDFMNVSSLDHNEKLPRLETKAG